MLISAPATARAPQAMRVHAAAHPEGIPMTRTSPPVSVFGVPTDIGASRRGASMGPEALRVAGLVEAIAARGIDVRDIGDVQGPRNPISAPVDGYRHLDEVVAWNRAVFDMSTRELQAGRMPIMLGGDHCLG